MTRFFRRAYAITVWLLVAAVLIQFTLAGLGVFATVDVCNLVPIQSFGCGFALHAWFGRLVLSLLFLILLILAFAARVPWRLTGRTAGLLGLFVLQGLLLFPYYRDLEGAVRAVSALHVVNGILILFLALHVAGRARDLVVAQPSRPPERVPADVVSRPARAKGG